MSIVETNAVIESASVRLDKGSFLSVWLDLKLGIGNQGFGGYVLGATSDCEACSHSQGPNYAAEFIVRCLEAAGVDSFDKLAGRTIRVRRDDEWSWTIHAIGHIVKDDLWFSPTETFESWKKEVTT